MTEGPQLTNGHDKAAEEDMALAESINVAHVAIILRSQLAEMQISAARQAERATVEALMQDAMRRHTEALQKGDFQAVTEAMRDIFRLEIYLSRRGLV